MYLKKEKNETAGRIHTKKSAIGRAYYWPEDDEAIF
jgi:hypothetical protein